MYNLKKGSESLVTALHALQGNERKIQSLAGLLDYQAEQLSDDIQALVDYRLFLDSWSNSACSGYALSALIGAGFSNQQICKFFEVLDAAFENMCVSEAASYFDSSEF